MTNKVGIIGMGFVGFPMAVVISNLKFNYKVVGIERDNKIGESICDKINNKQNPILSQDHLLEKYFVKSIRNKKLYATTNLNEISSCDIVIVSVGFDFYSKESLINIVNLISKIALKIKNNSLVVVETTLPPGFSEKIILPILNKSKKNIYYVYSFERATPGSNYYNSITNAIRVFSAKDSISKKKFKNFFSKIINTAKYPMTEIKQIASCELTKVLENSYRAMNIAFIDEWVKFSIKNKVNLNDAITEVKKRSTHSNIMRPGIGVGGYCLTKDPYFIKYSSSKIFKNQDKFPFVNLTLSVNKKMPRTSAFFVHSIFKNIKKPKLLFLGKSYKEDVKDLRFSPSIKLKEILSKKKYDVDFHDPYFSSYNLKKTILKRSYDGIVFCVPHSLYKNLPISFFSKNKIYIDLNMVINKKKLENLKRKKIKIYQLGS